MECRLGEMFRAIDAADSIRRAEKQFLRKRAVETAATVGITSEAAEGLHVLEAQEKTIGVEEEVLGPDNGIGGVCRLLKGGL